MTNQRIVTGLMLALVVWGVCLAIGATGYFIQSSLTDVRKSLIVAACMAGFLGLWIYVLRSVEKRNASGATDSEAASAGPTADRAWSKPGITSLVMQLLAAGLWMVAVTNYGKVSPVATTILGWSVAGLVMGAATSGMIALSNPGRLKGKWLGFCGLIQFPVALVVFVLRMTP